MQYFAYSQKAFVYKYIVMLSDVDQFQHMSFANYSKLMFLATDALFISCFNAEFLVTKRLKAQHTRLQFKRQTVSGDNILIKINSSEVEGAGFSLLYTFVMEETGELVGLGHQKFCLRNSKGEVEKYLPEGMCDLLRPIQVDERHLLYKY